MCVCVMTTTVPCWFFAFYGSTVVVPVDPVSFRHKLIGGLGGEKARWGQNVQALGIERRSDLAGYRETMGNP